jgi:hypothetical protein
MTHYPAEFIRDGVRMRGYQPIRNEVQARTKLPPIPRGGSGESGRNGDLVSRNHSDAGVCNKPSDS